MKKTLLPLLLTLTLLSTACKKEEDNDSTVIENRELTADIASNTVNEHTRGGENRSVSQGNQTTTLDGTVYTTRGSTRGNQVREIITVDITSITQRKRKSDKDNDLEIVWFAESDKEDNYNDNLVYWCYADGTYDAENWSTGESYWGHWYSSEDGSKLAYDLGSEFEEIFQISSINNSTYSLKNEKTGVKWTYTGYGSHYFKYFLVLVASRI